MSIDDALDLLDRIPPIAETAWGDAILQVVESYRGQHKVNLRLEESVHRLVKEIEKLQGELEQLELLGDAK